MERRFVKTGIPGLDEILGGGLLEGSISARTGPTGSGKSTLAAQFLYGGAVEAGETGLYLAIEESKRDFMFHMSGYAWDFGALERERRFVFLDYPIHEVDQIINQASAIQEIINSTGTKRVVIDSIMPIALYFKGDEERKRGFLKFIENIRKWGTTTFIISEDTKMGESTMPGSEFGIERFTDGWINVFFKYDEKSMERKRYVEVVKMKGIAHSSRSFPAVMGNAGFSIIHELAPKAPIAIQKKPVPAPKEAAPAIEEEVERAFTEKPHRLMKPEPPPEAPKPKPEKEAAPAPKPKAEIPKEPQKPEAAKAPPQAKPPQSGVRRLLKDEEFEQLKKLLAESGEDEGEKPSTPPPPVQKAAPKTAAKAKKRPPPAKMSPSIAQKIAEAKKKLMKK
ncbi:MAG: ATPase domain-containing protein [Candidatus Micrarchaeota archaeon]